MRHGLIPLWATLLSGLLLTGCGDVPPANSGSGTLSLSIVDTPLDEASKVEITLNSIDLKPYAEETITYTFDPPRTINLLDYQGSQALALLSDETVVGGKYSWVQLNIDTSKSYIYIGPNRYRLAFPDGEAKNRSRINESFTLEQDGTIALTIDVDLRRSILEPLTVGGAYRLIPSFRMVENSKSGTIKGTVPNTIVNGNGCTGFSAIYLFEGSNVTADDLDGTGAEPYASSFLTVNNDSDYDYEIGFVPAGNYTIAFTCQANLDKPESDDTSSVNFTGTDNLTVVAGETVTHDF